MADPQQLLVQARAAHVAGQYPRACRLAEQALGDTAAPALVRAQAALQVAKSSWNLDDVARCAQMLEAAVEACGEDSALRPVLAEALALQGACHARREQPVRAVQALRRAIALLQPEMASDVRRAVYVGVGLGYQGLGLARQATQAYREALDIVRGSGEPPLQLRAAMNLCYAVDEAVWQAQRVNPGDADRLLQDTLALKPWMEGLARAIGTSHAEMECMDAVSRLLLRAGRDAEAREALTRLLEKGADSAGDLRCDWHLALAELTRKAGEQDAFTWHVAAARHAAGEAYRQPVTAADLRRAAELLAHEGQAREALDLAWRYHARMVANETAALEARLEEMSSTLAHQTLRFQVSDLRQQNAGLAERQHQLVQLSRIDPLTGALNRRGLEAEHARLGAHGGWSHLLLIDLDHFKQINDTHGHAVGDEVLRCVSRTVAAALRGDDAMARLGGEEFAVVFGGTDSAGALQAAQRLLGLVQGRQWQRTAPGLAVSFSGGLVALQPGEPLSQALQRADALLYRAKAAGRARIEAGLGT